MNVADSKKCIKCSKENKTISIATVISTKTVRKLIQMCTVYIHVNNQ